MEWAQIAVVASLTGKAYARNADGELRELAIGDVLFEGEIVVTPDGGKVELTLNDGSLMVVDTPEVSLSADLVAETAAGPDESAVQDETIDAVLAALESGEDLGDILEATAAGPSGGGAAGAGHSFIRLGRIAESTDEFSGILGSTGSEADAIVDQDEVPVDAIDDEATTDAGTPVVISVETNDIFAEGEDVIAITQPENGSAILNEDDTVTYTPDEGFSGTDTFTYNATNPDGTQGDTAIVTVIVNPPAEPPELPEPPEPEEPPLPEPPAEILPEINIGDDVVIEGGTAQVIVSLDKQWDEPITVSFQTEDDTATVAGGDYDPETGTITFEPGVTELVILVSTNEDNIKEGSEFFNVNLSDPVNATIGDDQGIVEIIDDYEEPTITISDDTVVEGATGSLTVSLSRAVEEEVTVGFVSADGTAIEVNGDYLGTSGTLTFAPGETELIINVITLDDAVDEPTEFMLVNLSNAENAVIEDPQGQVTIGDNDSPPPENEPPIAQNETVTVDEAALASGSNSGSNVETVAGQLNAIDADGDTLTYVAGVQVGTYGTLEINANGSYVYTLNNRFDTNPDTNNGPQTELGAEQFQFTVLDGNGGSDIGTVSINIIDDVPEAVDDGAYSVDENTIEVITFETLLANDTRGADQSVTVTLGTDASNGSVVVVGETFVYTPKAGYEGADSFTYIITDADGDTSKATVSLTVNPDSVPQISVVYAQDWVAESALDGIGSDAASDNESTSGDFNITHSGTDTTKMLEVQDKNDDYIDVTAADDAAGIDVEGDYGTLNVKLVDGEYVWTYVLSGATGDHDVIDVVEADDTVPESFAVRVTDSDGDMAETTLEIEIRDDGPEVAIGEADEYDSDVDSDVVPEAKNPAESIGGDISIVEGADQNATLTVTLTDGQFNGAALAAIGLSGVAASTSATIQNDGKDLGELTIDWDGTSATWEFEPVENTSETDLDDLQFTFSTIVTDEDDDTSSDSHTVHVDPVADTPTGLAIAFGEPSIEGNDLEVSINQQVGDEVGDDVINGTPNFDYNDVVVVPLDFGGEFANQVITINPSVDISGSWNHDGDGAYFDDNWGMIVYDPEDPAFGGGYNSGQSSIPEAAVGDPVAFFFYNQNITEPEPDNTTPVITDIGGTLFYVYGDPQNGENDSFTFSHTPSLDIQLNENGQAYVVFGAETTQQSESVIIDGVAVGDAPDTYVYGVDLDVGLADTDGSESMTVVITLNTFEEGTDTPLNVSANLLDATEADVPDTGDQADNQWVVTVAAGQSLDEVFELRMLQTEEPFDFSVTITAEATEAANGDTAETTSTSGRETVPGASVALASFAAESVESANDLGAIDPPEQVGTPDNELAAGEVALTGTLGNDVFVFDLANAGDAGSPVNYDITNFGESDALDLGDLLQSETEGTLLDYLNITSDGTDTVIEIASSGFNSGYDASEVDSTITLFDVDLGNDTAAAITELLNNSQLSVD